MTMVKNKLAVSSCAFSGKSIEEIHLLSKEQKITVEFSSGMKYSYNLESYFKNMTEFRYVHNYFPPPEVPFVLNLASLDDSIRQRSVDHCINGLKLAKISGSGIFSAHAGFCVDVDPEDLGQPFPRNLPYHRADSLSIFYESLEQILKQADVYEVDFCIENNVVASFNLSDDGNNPFLCAHAEEISTVIETLNHKRLFLLLDTGHLKVSAKTLKFNLKESVAKLQKYTRIIHHSDNDGKLDTNMKISSDYWFLPYLNDFSDSHHILEVKSLSLAEIKQQLMLLENKGVD